MVHQIHGSLHAGEDFHVYFLLYKQRGWLQSYCWIHLLENGIQTEISRVRWVIDHQLLVIADDRKQQQQQNNRWFKHSHNSLSKGNKKRDNSQITQHSSATGHSSQTRSGNPDTRVHTMQQCMTLNHRLDLGIQTCVHTTQQCNMTLSHRLDLGFQTHVFTQCSSAWHSTTD